MGRHGKPSMVWRRREGGQVMVNGWMENGMAMEQLVEVDL